MRTHVFRSLALLLSLGPASVAHAGTIVLVPFLPDATVTPKQQAGLFQLIASELDFSPGVDGVVEVKAVPAGLNDACLGNPGCLAGITQQAGGNQMLAGRMGATGANLVLDLVFFDGRAVAKRKQFQVPADAAGMANAMTPIIQEMINGKSAPEPAKAPVVAAMPDLDDGPAIGGPAMPAPVVAAPMPAPMPMNYPPPAPPPPAPLPPPVAVAMPIPAPVAAPVIDPSQISFKTSASDLSVDQINSMIRFGGPPAGGVPAPAPVAMPTMMPAPQPFAAPAPPPPPPAPPTRTNNTRIDEEEAELDDFGRTGGIVDLDDDGRGGRGGSGAPSRSGSSGPSRSGPTRSGPSSGSAGSELGHTLQFTGRGGFSKYYGFNFVTGGGEFGVAAAGGLHVVGGFEVFAVRRILPPDIAAETRIYAEWNMIYPANVGLIYKFPVGIAQPYIGADTIFVQYYKDEVGSDWAGGARARAGVDLMFVRNFGFNVNVAAGGWYGQNWPLIEQGTGAGGFLPQVSGGTVLAF